MRKFAWLGLVLVPFATMSAQSGVEIMAGLALGNLSFSSSGENVSYTSHAGFAGGIGLVKTLGTDLNLTPQVLFVQKGAKSSDGEGDEAHVTVGYIEVPVLLRAEFGHGSARPYVMAGGSMGIKVTCKFEVSESGVSASESCDDFGAGVKSTDFGAVVGAGVMTKSLGVSARYDLGLSNDSKDTGPDESVKTRTWLFLATIAIK